MTLLNLFQTGGLTLGLTVVFLVLEAIFIYQAIKARKSGTIQQGTASTKWQPTYTGEKIPWLKLNIIRWFAIPVFVLYIIALIIVASDYRGA